MVSSSATASYQPGKAPLLLNVSPSGLTSFLRNAKLFFRTKSVKDNKDRIAYLGAGLAHFPEIHNWYLSSAAVHEAKKYEVFTLDLQKRALPRDYIWSARGRIRSARQGERDFEDWLDELRSEHLVLTEKVLSMREFVEVLLYGMDVELSATLRQGTALKNSGLHQDDLVAIAFSTDTTTYPTMLDYEAFDREARNEWSKIAAQRHSNTAQLKSMTKRTISLSLGTPSSPSRLLTTSTNSTRTPNHDTGGRTRPPKLTELEHATRTTALVGVRAVHTIKDEDIDIPEGFGDDSDTDTDGVAIKGEFDYFTINEFVCATVSLANDSWSSGPTTFLVAHIEEPFDVILGVPFIKRNRISLSFEDPGRPQILVKRDEGLKPYGLLAPTYGPCTALEPLKNEEEERREGLRSRIAAINVVDLERRANQVATEEWEMKERAGRLMTEFDDLFLATLPPLTDDYLACTTTRHRIRLEDPGRVHNQRGFNIPRKWREAWKRMLEEHLAAGRLRPSTSPFAAAAFVVPKKDTTANPRWVNDYRGLNSNTIKDRTPLPIPDIVLADAALARFWGKIDMTNVFFQTPVYKEDIPLTAIKTPWGLFEWTVMPQGLCNAPATHQARVNEALRHLVGVCCQAFVDDIIIYSNTLEEHEENCRAVLSALRAANLYCSRKKTDLFSTRTEFLGHIILRDGIEADPSKTEKIKNWGRPKTITQVRGFLGIVQYLRKFIPSLAEHTAVLTPLTRKGLTSIEHLWTAREEKAFGAIKRIVTSLPVLKALDQDSKFAINTAVNESTGKTPFELVIGHTPSHLHSPSQPSPITLPAVEDIVEERQNRVKEARDALAAAKVRQAEQANRKHSADPSFVPGDSVMVDSTDRRARYKSTMGDSRVAKLFPRYDGPYTITECFPHTATYRLALPHDNRSHPIFHTSKLKPYIPNNSTDFPSCTPPCPEPMMVDGEEEYVVEKIIDEKGNGDRRRYLVKWSGYPESENSWEPLKHVEDTVALEEWETRADDVLRDRGRGRV
ncbi:hypothetical protein JCM21900_002203 [Sporobolomyces salmonicolor]